MTPFVKCVLVGKTVAFARPGATSAIDKSPAVGAVPVDWLGLSGDEQADPRYHGGPDKAIHGYAWSHYAAWRTEIPQCPLWGQPGAFGENLSIEELDESSLCIGDRWTVGTTVLEITQGRQPCWKLNHRFGVPDMSSRVQDSLRAGWYYKVIERGVIGVGDPLTLVSRPYPAWTVERLLRLIRDKSCDRATLLEVLELPLPLSWRKLFTRRADLQEVEDWGPRMLGRDGS